MSDEPHPLFAKNAKKYKPALDALDKTPNPGSDAAIKLGCRCPVLDNAHGRGWMGGAKDENGEPMFVISEGCPLHWKTKKP